MTIEKPYKYATIGIRIQSIRSSKSLSQTKFAANIGISQRFLSDLETGRIKPSKPILLAIEYVYHYRWEWIITGDEPVFVDIGQGPGLMYITPPDQQETTDRQTIYWSKRLARIIKEGDTTKIEAVRNMLKALDPGEDFKEKSKEGAV